LQRLTKILVFCLLAAMPAAAEEISLKDGTKIVGHMTAISADKIEVETSDGKSAIEIMLLATREGLGNFEELAQSSMAIDGRPSLVVYYRGTLRQSNNLPVEPLFHDMQPTFEKILSSYHSTAGQATASSAKP